MTRTPLSIAIGFVVPALVACASAPAQPVADRIIIPDDAAEVDHIDFFTRRELIRLNQRMLILRSGVRPYLVVFNETCLNLNHADPHIAYRTRTRARSMPARRAARGRRPLSGRSHPLDHERRRSGAARADPPLT
jgi:hypothetical protein